MMQQIAKNWLSPQLRSVVRLSQGTFGQLRCLSIATLQARAPLITHNSMTSSDRVSPPRKDQTACIHTTARLPAAIDKIPKNMRQLYSRREREWLAHNDVIYPPMTEGNLIRPAEVTHVRTHIRYSHKKFWYIGLMIRGMSVDEALKQLSFYNKKGALIVKEILEEAIDLAVTEHNVEYRSNLWVCDAYACRVGGRGYGYFRRMGGRIDIIRHSFSNFYVRLREGRPPKMIYSKERDGHEQLEEYVDNIRKRRIYKSL